MNNKFIFSFISLLLVSLFNGCSKDNPKIEPINLYFHEANVANQNGDIDTAIKYYKLFLKSGTKEDESLLEFVNLQLARISFSKGYYDEALLYAHKVTNSDLFVKAYWLKEETFIDHTMKGLLSDEETNKINSFDYSLKNNALAIIGSCYLKKGEYEFAIKYFNDIKPESESYYYLALVYGLKRDLINERKYYELNSMKGSFGLIETREWLENNSKKYK